VRRAQHDEADFLAAIPFAIAARLQRPLVLRPSISVAQIAGLFKRAKLFLVNRTDPHDWFLRIVGGIMQCVPLRLSTLDSFAVISIMSYKAYPPFFQDSHAYLSTTPLLWPHASQRISYLKSSKR